MTGAFTLPLFAHPIRETELALLYGIYLQQDPYPPNSPEDIAAIINYIPEMAYPMEVVHECRK